MNYVDGRMLAFTGTQNAEKRTHLHISHIHSRAQTCTRPHSHTEAYTPRVVDMSGMGPFLKSSSSVASSYK